jgi:hypothetical protein
MQNMAPAIAITPTLPPGVAGVAPLENAFDGNGNGREAGDDNEADCVSVMGEEEAQVD